MLWPGTSLSYPAEPYFPGGICRFSHRGNNLYYQYKLFSNNRIVSGGGGGYLVASKLLSPTAGMVSGCALLVDYTLTITLSIASGADAIFSFFPLAWQPFKIWFAVTGILILVILNLRELRNLLSR